MSLFQGHLACQNFTPTKPHPGKVTVEEGKLYVIGRYPGEQFIILSVVTFSFDVSPCR